MGAALIAAGMVLLPGPAAAQPVGVAEPGGVTPIERAAPVPSIDAGPERIAVVGAHDMTGRAVVARNRAAAGQISHVLADPASGWLRDILINNVPGLALGDQLVTVPWTSVVASPASATVALTLTMSELATAPRIRDISIASTGRPEVTAQVFEFDTGDAGTGQPPPPITIEHPPPPPGVLALPSGRVVPTTTGPPVLVSAASLSGIGVTNQDGRPLGEIGEAMLDLEHSHVAYVLIAEGGLRTPRNWLPVPIQILVASGNGYAVAVEDFWLRQVAPLPGPQPPSAVGSAWLKALYANYGLPPYWR